MPESKKRKKAIKKQQAEREHRIEAEREPERSPSWWAPLMVGLMVLGLVIIVTAYVSKGQLPIPGGGNTNLFVGFGVMIAGFLMTIGWK